MTEGKKNWQIRSLIVPVFLPSLMFSAGEAGLIPILPTIASKLGADLPTAGFVTGLAMVGTLVFDLPAARLVSRIGERRAMMFAALVAALSMVGAYFAPNLFALGVSVFFAGSMLSIFGLARHGYLTEVVPFSHRARTLAILGGMFRGGAFLGPALAALVIFLVDEQSVFVMCAFFCLSSAVLLLFVPADRMQDTPSTHGGSTWEIAKRERSKLATIGVASAILGAMRTTRQVGLPLWGIYIGLHPGTIALFIGIAGAIDFALFYSSGQIMDKWGRRFAVVPTLVGMAVTHLALLLAHDAGSFLWVAIAMSLANALGSGIILTLGADLAPADARNEFLAAFRLLVDAGVAVTPILISTMAATIALPGAMVVMSTISLYGAVVAWRYLPRFGIK